MIKVIYSENQVANPGHTSIHGVLSPSATKPKLLAQLLKNKGYKFIEPQALTINDLKRCHSPQYVENIFDLSEANGFGTFSEEVNKSLLYTNGAMYTACKHANPVSCALVSGFHHAGYAGFALFGYFCTFNGLMASALKLICDDGFSRIAILDCDMHHGNGTDDILKKLNPKLKGILHISFGKYLTEPKQADLYLDWLDKDGHVETLLKNFNPQILIYQAGVDVHIDDPFGGILTTEQIYERDLRVFTITKKIGLPISWCLAGGYQKDINKVLMLHMNTFAAAEQVYQ
jgi:acetoin utilization deacetylase AcuC-like enzyme